MDRIPFNMNPGPQPGRNPRNGPRKGGIVLNVVIAALVLLFFFGSALVSFWVDWRWFTEVGYNAAFWSIVGTRWGMALAFGALFFLIAALNTFIAVRRLPAPAIPVDLRGQMEVLARRSLGPVLYTASAILSLLAGLAAGSQWNAFLLFRNAAPFGVTDPLFQRDVGFYVFQLPFVNFTVGFLMSAFVLTLIGVLFAYAVTLAQYYDPVHGWSIAGRRVPPGAARHVSALMAIILLLKAAGYWLGRYGLLYGMTDAVRGGAGFTDVHARLPALNILAALSVVAALIWLIQLAFKKLTWGIGAVAFLVVVSIFGGIVYPGGLQQVRVKPNELTAEEPYIRRNIEFTRRAYGLDRIRQTEFSVRNDPTPGLIRRNEATIENARLWDYTIAAQSFRQLQEIKPYYSIREVDVDRYMINGRYRQVLISAREMSQDDLPEQAKSFLNRHLVYTHGIGFVMSPVNEVSGDGQPVFLVNGIPPRTNTDLKISQSRVYFGEQSQPWVVVGGDTPEFDYPGDEDMYNRYDGKAGIRVGGLASRLALTFYLGDQNFLLSRAITADSRLIINRTARERIRKVAPYLSLDSDSYPVLADGRLVWMQDAYTTTSRYPYSERVNISPDARLLNFNYIRNSVKAVVDAYDGTVTLYIADADDPILQTYAKAFPGVYRPMSEMPESLRAHIRYPEDLFEIQSRKYLLYHMTDPKTFYTGEDAWDLPRLSRGTVGETGESAMEAYYVIMRLPGSQDQEMVMIRPFTPRAKNNMVAWMAARCDPKNYGETVVYRFPQDSLPLGPAQVAAGIRQRPEISKELTLLNQQGSQAILGNMLTIPLERSLLYIQPLYVQSAIRGISRADVARVIVSYGNRVYMGATLAEALNAVFGAEFRPTVTREPGAEPTAAAPPPAQAGAGALVDRAVAAFERAQTAQRAGDWAAYGAALKDLEGALQQLQQQKQ